MVLHRRRHKRIFIVPSQFGFIAGQRQADRTMLHHYLVIPHVELEESVTESRNFVCLYQRGVEIGSHSIDRLLVCWFLSVFAFLLLFLYG